MDVSRQEDWLVSISSRENILTNFEKFMIFFIVIQPVIDLLTSLSIYLLGTSLTVGIIIRFGVLSLTLIYIHFAFEPKVRKRVWIFFLLFALVLLVGLINNMIVKDPMTLFSEIKNIAKIVYAPIMLFGYLAIFTRAKQYTDVRMQVQRNIYYAMLIVSLVMVIAAITGTGIKSYESEKLGQQGWFFAGNEIGAIMAISLPVVLYYTLKMTNSKRKLYYWVPVILLIISMLLVGTKVGYLAVLITLIVSQLALLIEKFRNREKSRQIHLNSIINLIVLAIFLAITPFTPVAYNTKVHLSWWGIENNFGLFSKSGEEGDTEEHQKREKAVENVVLSGREEHLDLFRSYYEDAPLSQKLFGMGYGGNYKAIEDEVKSVEMDYYDIFFSFGIIGFLVYLLAFIYFSVRILISFFKNIKDYFNCEVLLIGSSVALGLGIAYLAGHVLTAPAVSIYLVILFAYLYIALVQDNKPTNELSGK